jgi:hypothetical protein
MTCEKYIVEGRQLLKTSHAQWQPEARGRAGAAVVFFSATTGSTWQSRSSCCRYSALQPEKNAAVQQQLPRLFSSNRKHVQEQQQLLLLLCNNNRKHVEEQQQLLLLL